MTSPVEYPEMVDTMVLVYASMTTNRVSRNPALQSFHTTSLELLERLPIVRVSAIAWFEFLRILRTAEKERMAAVLQKVFVERVDQPIVEFAAWLIRERNGAETVCDHCLGATKSATCPKCNKVYSAQQRLNDALIVATANVLETVKILWSFDGGALDFGRYCRSCSVQRPQSAMPLFDPQTNPAVAAAAGRPHLVSIPVSQLGVPASQGDTDNKD